MLQQDHIRPLTEYVDDLRRDLGLRDEVPYFDPLDGGTTARCLCLDVECYVVRLVCTNGMVVA